MDPTDPNSRSDGRPGATRSIHRVSAGVTGGRTAAEPWLRLLVRPAAFVLIALLAAGSQPCHAHVHIEIRLLDGKLRLVVYDFESGAFPPMEYPFVVPAAAQAAVPPYGLTNLLGPAGTRTFILPQFDDGVLPFLGIGAGSLPAAALAGGQVRLRLVSVDGPGRFVVWQSGQFGHPRALFNSADGIDASDRLTLATGPGSHLHASFGFGAPGRYQVTFRAEGHLASGESVDSADTTFLFLVEEPPASRLSLVAAGEALFLRASGAAGAIRLEQSDDLSRWSTLTNLSVAHRSAEIPWRSGARFFRAVSEDWP